MTSKYFDVQDLVSPEEILNTAPTKKPRAPEIYSIANHLINSRDRIEAAEQAVASATGQSLVYPNAMSKLNHTKTSNYNNGVYTLDIPSHTQLIDGQYFDVRWGEENTEPTTRIKVNGVNGRTDLFMGGEDVPVGMLTPNKTSRIIYHAVSNPFFELVQTTGLSISYIPVPDALIDNTYSRKTLLSQSYTRKFSKSKVIAEAHMKTRFTIVRSRVDVDTKGEAYAELYFGGQTKRIVTNNPNSIESMTNANDFVMSLVSGSCCAEDIGSGDIFMQVRFKIESAAQGGYASPDFYVNTQDEGFLKIIEVEL